MTIRTRLLMLMVAVMLPACAVGMWTIVQAYRDERAAVQDNLLDTTRALSMVVDAEVARREAIAQALAGDQLLDSAPTLAPEQLREFEAGARAAMKGLRGWVELRSAQGVVSSTRTPLLDGAAAPATPPRALRTTPTYEPLARDASSGQWYAAVVQPIEREGVTVLNLAVTVTAADLQGIVESQRLPSGWRASVIDANRALVARVPADASLIGLPVQPELQQRLQSEPEGRLDFVARDGVRVQGYYRTSPRRWTYLTAMPHEPFVAALRGHVGRLAAGALALLALALGGALWVARRIERPVLSLQHAAALMQAGLPVLPASTGIAECDQVAAALADASRTLRAAQDTLEEQVAEAVERTRDAEERAAHGRRVEALGRLTGGVAHDFNNLLGVISNSAHLIRRHAPPDAALDKPLQATLNAVESGRRLTENLLRFAGRRTVQPAVIELGRFLPEASGLLATVLGPRIEVEIAVAPDTPAVAVDASELELALINLSLNARDAMRGGGHVWLKARGAKPYETLRLPPQAYVLVTFTDDGPGMDESLVAHAFEPFVTSKPANEGAGLGLSQVHGFCTQAGGTARLDSTPGHGTTVSLLLPAQAAGAHAPSPAPAASGSLTGRRVLVVEDHRELGAITVDLLRTYGCEVERARHADEAIALLEAGRRFDVVLSDIVMPGHVDGLDLARRLRERRPAVPVVLTTGYSIAMAAAQDFPVLRKPCTPDALVSALLGAMRAAQPARSA